MNRFPPTLLFFLFCSVTFGISPTEEMETLNSKRDFLPLWTKASIIPSLSALVDGVLYYTASDDKCGGSGLFQVDPEKRDEKVIATKEELPCVQGLQEFKNQLFIQYLDSDTAQPQPFMAGVQFALWNGSDLTRQIKDKYPALGNARGDLAFLLHGLGDKHYDPKQGAAIRKQHFAERGMLFSEGNNSFLAVLISGPKGTIDFHPMLAILPLENKSLRPTVGPVVEWNWKKDRISEMVLGSNGRLYFLRKDPKSNEPLLEEVEIKEQKRIAAFRLEAKPEVLHPHFLAALSHGLLLTDSPSLPGTQKRTLYFSLGDHAFHEVQLPSRDTVGLSAAPGGFLVSRRSGIYWHGKDLNAIPKIKAWVSLNSTASPKAPCGTLSVVEGEEKDTLKIYHSEIVGNSTPSEKVQMNEVEEIHLGTFTGVSKESLGSGNPWVCEKGALFLLAKHFHPNLIQTHLAVALEAATRTTLNATDAPTALTLLNKQGQYLGLDPKSLMISSHESEKNLLFVLNEASLTLVREAGSETRFDGIRKSRELAGQVDVFLKGDKEELEYKLVVGRAGRDLKGASIPRSEKQALP